MESKEELFGEDGDCYISDNDNNRHLCLTMKLPVGIENDLEALLRYYQSIDKKHKEHYKKLKTFFIKDEIYYNKCLDLKEKILQAYDDVEEMEEYKHLQSLQFQLMVLIRKRKDSSSGDEHNTHYVAVCEYESHKNEVWRLIQDIKNEVKTK